MSNCCHAKEWRGITIEISLRFADTSKSNRLFSRNNVSYIMGKRGGYYGYSGTNEFSQYRFYAREYYAHNAGIIRSHSPPKWITNRTRWQHYFFITIVWKNSASLITLDCEQISCFFRNMRIMRWFSFRRNDNFHQIVKELRKMSDIIFRMEKSLAFEREGVERKLSDEDKIYF